MRPISFFIIKFISQSIPFPHSSEIDDSRVQCFTFYLLNRFFKLSCKFKQSQRLLVSLSQPPSRFVSYASLRACPLWRATLVSSTRAPCQTREIKTVEKGLNPTYKCSLFPSLLLTFANTKQQQIEWTTNPPRKKSRKSWSFESRVVALGQMQFTASSIIACDWKRSKIKQIKCFNKDLRRFSFLSFFEWTWIWDTCLLIHLAIPVLRRDIENTCEEEWITWRVNVAQLLNPLGIGLQAACVGNWASKARLTL